MSDLKPCPFCGGKAHTCGDEDQERVCWVMCPDCLASAGGNYPTMEEAITAWNTRADKPKPITADEVDAFYDDRQGLTMQELADSINAHFGLGEK